MIPTIGVMSSRETLGCRVPGIQTRGSHDYMLDQPYVKSEGGIRNHLKIIGCIAKDHAFERRGKVTASTYSTNVLIWN